MNKIVVTMLLLVTTMTLAQEKRERHHRGNMHNMTPEQIATLQTKKMTLALDLSEAQQDQIHALNLEHAQERKSKMEERKAAKEEGGRKELTSEERFAKKNERLDAKLAHKQKMKKILSEAQMEKWEQMHHGKRKQRRHGKGRKAGRKK